MKSKVGTFFLFLLMACSLNAQQLDKHKIGFAYSSFGDNMVIQSSDVEGGASYYGQHFYTLGCYYLTPINTWLEFETGLEYLNHTILIEPAPMEIVRPSHNETISLINIPVTVRANFLKYFFLNGGIFLGLDADLSSSSIDDQSGIGCLFGIGVKYDFDFGGSIFVNPYSKLHALIPVMMDADHERIVEAGIRLGLTYSFN
jgi:hypothetical protein